MAESTVILRPVSDISVVSNYPSDPRYDTNPEEATSLYLLVNEETADDDATYIRQWSTASRTADNTYTFGLDTSKIPSNVQITGVRMFVRGRASSYYDNITGYLSLVIDGTPYGNTSGINLVTTDPDSTTTPIYGTKSDSLISEGLDTINAFIVANKSMPPLQFAVRINAKETGTQSKNYYFYFTQCYVEITYTDEIHTKDSNIYRKVNGVWVPATYAYEKRNGAWVLISEDKCKEVLQNALVIRGDSV